MFCGGACHGQISEQQAKATAEKATRVGDHFPDSTLIRVHRREDLEDDLFGFQTKTKGKIAKAAYFFEVSTEGAFVLSPNEAVYIISEDGHLLRLVAISARSGEAYLLSGFSDAASEFNRMVTDTSLRISSTKDAEMYAGFWFTATTDPSSNRVIYNERQLKHKVEDYFFYNYPEDKAGHLYNKWWLGFSSAHLNPPFDRVATKSDLGYETPVAAMSSLAAKMPLLELWTLKISPNGICEMKNIRTIYPTKSNSRSVNESRSSNHRP